MKYKEPIKNNIFPYCEKKDFDKAEKKYLAVESTVCEKKVSISTTTTNLKSFNTKRQQHIPKKSSSCLGPAQKGGVVGPVNGILLLII
jgi:hypothetical protein